MLNHSTFDLFCIQAYENPHCVDVQEYISDIKKLKYIKRLINKYIQTGELRERLLLNHIISFLNVFNLEKSLQIFVFDFTEEQLRILFPFLDHIGVLPEYVFINDRVINTREIVQDKNVIEVIQKNVV